MTHVERLSDFKSNLGEGPFWDVRDQTLYYVDMRGDLVWRYDPSDGSFSSWPTPSTAVGVSRTRDGRFVVVLADGFHEFDPERGTFSQLAIATDLGGTLSESKVDRQGRYVAGTETSDGGPLVDLPATGNIISWDGHNISTLDTGFRISNGVCWSPDGETVYITDSIAGQIYAYDYETETGTVSGKRVFVDFSHVDATPEGALPDGATVDSEGRVWSAICGAGLIIAFSPSGEVDKVLEVPFPWIASLAFGGPDLDQLYVTSMDPTYFGLPADDTSGYLYRVDGHGARGLAEPLVELNR